MRPLFAFFSVACSEIRPRCGQKMTKAAFEAITGSGMFCGSDIPVW